MKMMKIKTKDELMKDLRQNNPFELAFIEVLIDIRDALQPEITSTQQKLPDIDLKKFFDEGKDHER